jgi:hypothetical protein
MFGNIISVLIILIGSSLFSPAFADNDATWFLSGNKALYREYPLPLNDKRIRGEKTKLRMMDKIHYSIESGVFYLELVAVIQSGLISKKEKPKFNRHFYRIHPKTGQAGWTDSPGANEKLLSLQKHGKLLLLNSSMIRQYGTKDVPQPFGKHHAQSKIDEVPYDRKRYQVGFPFGETGWVTDHLGKGYVQLDILDEEKQPQFSIKVQYSENSGQYSGYWTPDGKYFLLMFPVSQNKPYYLTDRAVIAGPFGTESSSDQIDQALVAKEQKRKQRARRSEYLAGRMTPEEYFGPVYNSARQKILNCSEISRLVGSIQKLTVQKNSLNFGNPEIVGKHFTFAYEAEKGEGKIQVVSLHPKHLKKWGEQYRPYLQSVTIKTKSTTYNINCL